MNKKTKGILFHTILSAVFMVAQIGCSKSEPEAEKTKSDRGTSVASKNEEKSQETSSSITKQEAEKELQEDKDIIELKPMEEKDITPEIRALFEESKLNLEDYEKDKEILKYPIPRGGDGTKYWHNIGLKISPDKKYVAEFTVYYDPTAFVDGSPPDLIEVDGFLKLYTFDGKKLWEYKDKQFASEEYIGPDNRNIEFSSNSKYVITTGGGKKGRVVLFDIKDGTPIFLYDQLLVNKIDDMEIIGIRNIGEQCDVSDEGKIVIGQSPYQQTIFSKDLTSEGGIYTFDNNGKLLWHKENICIRDICISNDGNIVVAIVLMGKNREDQGLNLYDANDGSVILRYSTKNEGPPQSIFKSPDSKIIGLVCTKYEQIKYNKENKTISNINVLLFDKKGRKIARMNKKTESHLSLKKRKVKDSYLLLEYYNHPTKTEIYNIESVLKIAEKNEGGQNEE